MSKKITWRMVLTDFKKHYPNLGRNVEDYRPHDQMTILIWLKDGSKITYNYLDKKVRILNDRWKD